MAATPVRVEHVACDACGRETKTVPFATGRDFEYDTCPNGFRFVRCSVCSLVFLDPRPTADELERIYPPEYEPFHFGTTSNPFVRIGRTAVQRRKVRTIARFAPRDAQILDAGCGSGELLRLLRAHGPRGWRLYGNDASELALGRVRGLGFPVLPGRIEELTTDRRFDLVILNQTLEHLASPERVLERIAAITVPGGYLLVETPSLEGLDARAFRRRHWGGYHFPRHWTLFDARTLAAAVRRHGYDVVEVAYLPSPAFWCQSVHHTWLERGLARYAAGFWTINNPIPLAAFTLLDLALGRFRPTSTMRLAARLGSEVSELRVDDDQVEKVAG
ncbi:MAG TPA: class I SAM-dependent methyltransferase [Gaiellaceae bacterium]|nr:class I SAM-dependent methyltransferase [Gaiellaceae bacterium]